MAKEKKQSKMDLRAVMEVYSKLATPGEPHRILATLAGVWDAEVKCWAVPNAPPMESSGICEQKMVLGGRFLQQKFAGEMMGSRFIGIGFAGYDNHTKKYVSTWIDSMSTAIMYFKGKGTADGKVVTQQSRSNDPIKGPMKWRSVSTIVDHNTLVFELYGTDKGGKEEKILEITYTRKH
jgi:hypothetical protein